MFTILPSFWCGFLTKGVAVVYVLAALWGVADAIWQTQINALYGVLFAKNEEAAFSNYRLWESLGFLFAFLTQVSLILLSLWNKNK
jgi:hypothetical protein